jgi:hypothetical protein
LSLEPSGEEGVANDAVRLELRNTAPALGDGVFGIRVTCEGESRAGLRYRVEDLPERLP